MTDDETRPQGEPDPPQRAEAGARAGERDEAVAWFLAELARAASEPDDDLVGQSVGRFELTRSQHASILGTLYEARDGDSGERVAVRVITPDAVADEERRAALAAAAEAAVGLTHPNLAKVREVVEDGERLAIVSDLVEGLRLKERLERVHHLTLQEAQTVARGVARALAAAHDAGLTHLDVEPGNVVMSHTGVKLLDAGLGVAAGATLRGAPRYASPEQTRGEPCDASSDVFSFGVLLYELLTGTSPFAADDPAAVIARVRTVEPPPVQELRGEVSAEMAAFVARCLQKDRAARYKDGAALVAALEEFAPSPITRPPEPVPTASLSSTGGASPDATPRPWLEVAALLVVVVVLLFLMLRN